MTTGAKRAYNESIDMVELHQVTLAVDDQYAFISGLVDVLHDKLCAMRESSEYPEEVSQS